MATITTNTFLDGDIARTAGEAWTMNGGILTIRTDTRWHDNAPSSMTGSIGAVTVSATLGGGVLIDGRNVRIIAYNNGSGNVPAIGTSITQAGVSGYLLGVYADFQSAPTPVGNAMPTSGFIKFREVADGPFSAGSLTGIGADATEADRVGWIEVVQRQAVANIIPRLGFYRVRGDWFELGVTNGSPGQILQVPTNGGGAGTHVPGIWIETAPSSNEFEIYPAILDSVMTTTNLGTDQRSKFVQTMGNGQVRIGSNGTDTIGFVPPAGCKVRIPNVLGRQSTLAAGDANNLTPHPTLGTRPDFTTTASGNIDFEFFMNDWYHFFVSPFRVRLVNVASFDIHSTRNEASPTSIENYCIGAYNGTSISITLLSNPLGGIIKNSKFFRAASANNGHSCSITTSSDYIFENCHFGVITYARSTGRSITTSQCLNIVFNDIYQYNAYIQHATSFNIIHNQIDHCDRIVGNTNGTNGMYCFAAMASCNNIKVDRLTFGLKGIISDYCNPFLSLFYSINSSNISFRNAGTRSSPLAVASAALGPQYCVHDAGVNTNILAQRIYLEHSRTRAFLTVNTSKNSRFESVHGTVGPLQILSLNTLVKGARATSHVVTGGLAVYGSYFFDMFESDTSGRICFAMNEPTSFNEDFVTLTLTGSNGGFTSGGQVSMPNIGDELIMEMSYFALGHTGFDAVSPLFTGTNPRNFIYEYDIDKGSGFSGTFSNLMKIKTRSAGGGSGTSTVTISASNSPMPDIGDFVFAPAGTQIPAGTTVTDVTGQVITVSNNFTANLTGDIYFMKDILDEVISPSAGFKFKLRIITTDELNANAITYLSINTTSTLIAQSNNLYPLDFATINLFDFQIGSRIQIYNLTDNVEIYNSIPVGNTLVFTEVYTGDKEYRVRCMYQDGADANEFVEFIENFTVNGFSRGITQINDDIYIANGIDGSEVAGITIDDSALLINIDTGIITWQEIYAYETYWLYTEEGIRDEERFINAIDQANYSIEKFKIKNVSDPSAPLVILNGYAKDSVTGQAIDLIDTSGGTIFMAPDRVIPFSTSGGDGGDTKEAIYTYFVTGSRQNTFRADVSGLATEASLEVINNGVKKASLLIPHSDDI